ncbi:MAG: FkbM family methyltransferase [Planctomycetota bacterium]
MSILRKIAERLARRKIIKRHPVVAGKRIPVYVSPDAQLKYLKPGKSSYDQDLIRIAEKYISEGSNVWDIGANVGMFTFAAASMAGHGTVLAVEADTWLANILRRSARLKEYANKKICILPVAVSESVGVASFMIAARGRASNALESAGGCSQMGGVRETQYVPTLSLDTLLDYFPAPDFVKVDVEGAELMVARGAHIVIRKTRPVFYIEVAQQSSAEMLEIFRSADYVALGTKLDVLDKKCDANTYFVPSEKMDRFDQGRIRPESDHSLS